MNALRSKAWTLVTGQLGPLFALLLVFCFFAIGDSIQEGGGQFLTLRNLQTMLIASAPVVVAGLGMTIIIIAGGIDLSAGTATSLCATVLAWSLQNHLPIAAALLFCILTGCLVGIVNGSLVSALRVAPFIVTLGTMTACLGIAKLIAHETTVRPPLETIPDWMSALAMPSPQPAWLLVAPGVWLMLAMAA